MSGGPLHPLAALERTTLFRDLPRPALEELAGLMAPKRYARGRFLWRYGDTARELWVLLEGAVKVFHFGPDGNQVVVHLHAPPDTMGEPGLFAPERNLFRDNVLGFTINNFVGDGCGPLHLHVNLRDNRFLRQTAGGGAFHGGAAATDNSVTVVDSEGNVFDGSFRGMQLLGGNQQQIVDPASGNTICLLSSHDRFSGAKNDGVAILAANNVLVQGVPNQGQGNRVSAWFAGSTFAGNTEGTTPLDISATAGNGTGAGVGPGDFNRVDLTLCGSGISRVRNTFCAAGVPCDAASNLVEVLARTAFTFTNFGGGLTPDPSTPLDPPLDITCPGEVVAEASGPAGATVALSAPTVGQTMCSVELGIVSVDCAAGPRDFPIGETQVDCTATHVCGGTKGCSYTVTVADTTSPTISIAAPAAGASLILGSTVVASYACADTATGIAYCAGTVPPGAPVDTSTVGAKTLVVATSDGAGNVATAQQPYAVLYQPAGTTCLGDAGHTILRPIAADGTSVFKKGSMVPAKFRVCDAAGRSIGRSGVVASSEVPFRWDPTLEAWVANIATRDLQPGCTYRYVVGLDDGTQIAFQFGLTK